MRMKWARRVAAAALVTLGIALLVVGLFAYQLHIDHNPAMGTGRQALTVLGGILLLAFLCLLFQPVLSRWIASPHFQPAGRILRSLARPWYWLVEQKPATPLPPRRTGWYAVAGAVLAILITLWFMTAGRMVKWTPYSAYFNRQADAYLAGQLALLEKPPAALLSLADPYRAENRTGVGNILWDASLYKGKYYLYWGPVPALMAAAVKLLHPAWVIEDQYIIFFSLAGLAVLLAALFHWLHSHFLPDLPGWLVTGLVLLGVLNLPVFWLANRPAVYETSIAVGQFFLILGLYAGLRGMQSARRRLPWLVLAGLAWGAAIGSRLDLAFGIAWMVLLVCIYLLLQPGKRPAAVVSLAALILPLILWGAGLAWYNYARFGSLLETGHRYQLTGGALPADYRDIVSPSYILPNLYNLLARPFELHWREFPFVFTPFIRNADWPRLIFYPRNPNYFYDEPITGIFVALPVLWFLFFPLGYLALRSGLDWLKQRPSPALSLRTRPLSTWLVWMAAGAACLNLGILSVFIFSTMRYAADLTPLLTLLVGLSAGWAASTFRSRPRLRVVLVAIVGVLILASILIGLLANFQNGDHLFQANNPQLYRAIVHFLTGR